MAAPVVRTIVCDSPAAFTKTLDSAINFPNGGDASPIYMTVNASVTINGSYYGTGAYENIEYIYNAATITATELNRVAVRDTIYSAYEPHYEITLSGFASTWVDIFDEDSIPSDSFIAIFASLPSTASQDYMPFSPPKFDRGNSPFIDLSGTSVGTRRDHSAGPPSDNNMDVTLGIDGPLFRGSIAGGDLEMYFTLTGTINQPYETESINEEIAVDCSSWDSTDFRDITGTYTQLDTDANGITYDWEIVIA